MNFSFHSFIIVLMGLLLNTCLHKGDSEKGLKIIGKEIILPANIELLKGEFQKKIKFANGERKIISIIDADCPKCIIDNLNKTDSMFMEFLPKENIYFILNVKSSDSLFVIKHFVPKIQSEANILWDNGYHFEKQNEILSVDLNDRTFMLDENNKVIATGNPLIEPGVLQKYKKLASE